MNVYFPGNDKLSSLNLQIWLVYRVLLSAFFWTKDSTREPPCEEWIAGSLLETVKAPTCQTWPASLSLSRRISTAPSLTLRVRTSPPLPLLQGRVYWREIIRWEIGILPEKSQEGKFSEVKFIWSRECLKILYYEANFHKRLMLHLNLGSPPSISISQEEVGGGEMVNHRTPSFLLPKGGRGLGVNHPLPLQTSDPPTSRDI